MMTLSVNIFEPHWGVIFWTFVVFLIFFFILKKFAWPKITEALQAREKYLEESLEKAKKINEEYAKLTELKNKMMEEIMLEKTNIIKEAKSQAQNIINEAREKALEEQKEIIQRSITEINIVRNKVKEELKVYSINLAVELAKQILMEELEKDGKRQLHYTKLLKVLEEKLQ